MGPPFPTPDPQAPSRLRGQAEVPRRERSGREAFVPSGGTKDRPQQETGQWTPGTGSVSCEGEEKACSSAFPLVTVSMDMSQFGVHVS